jgi:glycosyltransferase involved in cell wall biosynthesis
MKITVVLPAKNEAGGLPKTLHALRTLLPQAEIIVSDDGSTDQTPAFARAAGARVISAPYSMGNGAAIKRGARAATGEVIVFMDADGQHDPAHIPPLLARLEQGLDPAPLHQNERAAVQCGGDRVPDRVDLRADHQPDLPS